jgi:hypothetical protein
LGRERWRFAIRQKGARQENKSVPFFRDYWILVTLWLSKRETVHAHSRRDIFQ